MSKKNRAKLPPELDFSHVRTAVNLVSGKWRLILILLVGEHILRFSQLREQIPTISEKMLAGELKALVALGVLHRKVYAEIPPRVEYTLTPKGLLALPLLRQLPQLGHIFN